MFIKSLIINGAINKKVCKGALKLSNDSKVKMSTRSYLLANAEQSTHPDAGAMTISTRILHVNPATLAWPGHGN